MILKSLFGKVKDKGDVFQYSLQNKNGMRVNIINYGAIVTEILTPDRNGNIEDVVLGYDSLGAYINDKSFMGAIVGRYGNRISKGKFQINDRNYQLSINNGQNHLHGGHKGFYKVLWDAETFKDDSEESVKLSYVSPDGEEGYPGNLRLSVTYTLTDGNDLLINYEGITDKSTILNPTHHSYFNLTGNFQKSILEHQLQIDANYYLPVDDCQIPTGTIENVNSTPMDFQSISPIGLHINDKFRQLEIGNGYDHTWVLNNFNGETRRVATLFDPSSGRSLEVFTDQPGIQFYSGNSLDETVLGKGRIKFKMRTGLCLETQRFPDSPNNAEFPSAILNPGETYKQETIYKFSTR